MRIRACVALVLLLIATPLCAQTVRVWDAPLSDDMIAATPTDVVSLFANADYDAATIATETLLDPAQLTPEALDLLVVPTQGSYPADGMDLLAEYLRAGGRVLTLGGVPFSSPLVSGPNGWEQVSVPAEPPDEVRVIADFDAVTPEVTIRGGEDEPIEWETVEADGGQAMRASVEDLQQWQYVEIPVADTGGASFSVLRFRARADANTPILGLELTESDDSRWKYVIPLSEDWREYTIYIPHFLSYATEGRGDEGDYLHPERLQTLSFGITKGMVGEGPHEFWLDEIERWQFEPPAREVVPRDRSRIVDTADAYGNLVKIPPGQQHPLVRLFEDAERIKGGWAIDVPTGSGPAYKNVVMSSRRTARVWPLIERDNGAQGGVVQLHDDELAGAAIGFFATDYAEPPPGDGDRAMWLSATEYLTRRPRVIDGLSDFSVKDGRAVLTAQTRIAGPVEECLARVTFAVTDGASDERTLRLTSGEHETLDFTLPASDLDPRQFAVTVSAEAPDIPADTVRVSADVRRTLIDLCDFFVEQQDEDGVIAGPGFVDQRAVRALLAMYDQTGKQEYLASAIRWGDNEIAMQRDDGGYRMGYGITDTSEACYVADGGEIAIGMARLVSYVPEDRREAYMQSLRDYFNYRESFRLDDGTITVGWVFNERFSQAGGEGRREIAFRSDKSFSFVALCTLAAAAAWGEITDDPGVREMVAHDARWFLDDVQRAFGVSGEAAQWAHYFADDPDLRADLEQRMAETLAPYALEHPGWWYSGGGRNAVSLGAIAYYYSQIDASPEALAAMLQGVYRMASPHSPASVYRVMADDDVDGDEWRYLAYGAVSLAEVLEPLSTMEGIDR